MNEAIARLTRNVEEKYLQIAALVNRLEAQDRENPNPKVDPLKKGADKEDEPPVEKVNAKPEPDQAAALMGSLLYPVAAGDDLQHHQGTLQRKLT
ncbi:hypothetical protein TB2_006793 [Malus domestica]